MAIAKEVDKRVTPKIVEAERQILGEENAARLDRTLAGVAAAGKVVYSAVEFAAPYIVEGGRQVILATPEVIKAGKQVYDTIDKKIIPEVVDTSRLVKQTVDRELPKVQAAGKQVQDCVDTKIRPEVDAAAKRFSDTVIPSLKEAERVIVPELTVVQRTIMGAQNADNFDRSVSNVIQQGRYVLDTVDRQVIPGIVSTTKTVVDAAATTTDCVVETGSAAIESGMQIKGTVDKTLQEGFATARDIVTEIDRAGGYLAYGLDGKVPNIVETTGRVVESIDKAIPDIVETGRKVQSAGKKVVETLPQIKESIETGARYIEKNLLMDDEQKVKTATFLAGAGVASVAASTLGKSRADDDDDDYYYDTQYDRRGFFGRGSGSATGISDNSRGFPSILRRRNNDDELNDEFYGGRSSSRSFPTARPRSRRFTR